MYFAILTVFIIYIIGVRANYSIDKGCNIKAKILNPIIVLFIFIFYLKNLSDKLYWLYYNLGELRIELMVEIGVIPPIVSFITWFLYLITCGILVALCWTLIYRKETTRVMFLRIIPFVWIVESIELYRLSMTGSDTGDELLLLILVLFSGIAWLIIYKLYSSKFIINFFRDGSVYLD